MSGSEEGLPPRRSQIFWLQRREPEITGPTTRSKTQKATDEETTTFSIEVDENNPQINSEQTSSQDINNINVNHFAISAQPEIHDESFITSENDNIVEPKDADKALNSPIWKKYMDEEYMALLNKKMWEVVTHPKTWILLEINRSISANVTKMGELFELSLV